MEYVKRKYPRLKQYDYSLPGYYYVTIHMEKDSGTLSRIIPQPCPERATVQFTEEGCIIQEQLLALERRYDYLKIDKYVIMPTHIHAIIRLLEGTLPRTDIPGIIGAFKSLASIEINKVHNTPGKKRFQRSFYDTVLRSEKAYLECWQYIDGNSDQWIVENTKQNTGGGGKPPPYFD